MLTNEERVNPEGFDEDSIERFSRLEFIYFDERNPNWIDTKVRIQEFSDQSDYF